MVAPGLCTPSMIESSLSERQLAAVETILYHQQPTGQPLLGRISTMGQGCLCGLKMKSEGVGQKRPVEAGALIHGAA